MHQLVRAFANAQDVQQSPRLQLRHGLGADHAAVGDHAHTRDVEALAQPVDHRDQRRYVGGVPRPHLRAHRPPVAIEQHGEDHLPQVRTMILDLSADSISQNHRAEVLAGLAGSPTSPNLSRRCWTFAAEQGSPRA